MLLFVLQSVVHVSHWDLKLKLFTAWEERVAKITSDKGTVSHEVQLLIREHKGHIKSLETVDIKIYPDFFFYTQTSKRLVINLAYIF